MNRPIRQVSVAVGVLLLALVVNLNYVQVVKSDSYRANPANRRVLLDEYARQRGSIVVQGVPVADSVATNDRLKYLRRYPQGALYAPVTGYHSLYYGDTAMEDAADPLLSGSDNRLFTTRFADLLTGRDPRGGNVVLTIDRAAQQAAYQAMAKQKGAVVAIDPSTGAILAAVSTPSFDPSALSSHTPAAIEKTYAGLSNDPAQPLLNRAFGQRYPPGSVFKVIVSAAALRDGRTPTSTVPSPDRFTLPGTSTTLENFEGESCGGATSTLDHALTVSCNTAFAKTALQLGEQKVRDEAARFGIDDQSSSVPLPVTASTLGPIVDDAALAQSAIGQRDVRITPLQGAMMSAAVANDGKLMKPYLVAQELAPNLASLSKAQPQQLGTVLDPAQAQQLRQMMVNVVKQGTGTAAQIDGIDVGGKTGTADTGRTDSSGRAEPPDAWFTGFAPAAAPKIAVAVIVENGGVAGNETTGGLAAAPIAKQVIQAYLASPSSK